ncbi:hypothetical protein GobsT_37350 [Gemmata obscuriglobus]|uniref:Uncharacterized protein n=1 Tax=Gemmata obscuriglobus TaxID=114 RepID=A0A2Z3GWQ0_9BACT|nr:hypothetical protein [Gemmata obscuriglobus]AWM38163.1 hypothetical protein C1280_14985 [Gemmata obscuriglobus]QEG28946.1 hypothetical protein GobsT_37350 [Gemmata obscuriglobus]VTS07467.1 unnamed protein product [Gemmata obscuriglobus UQM 2246]
MSADVLEPPPFEANSRPDREFLFPPSVLDILASPEEVEILSVDPHLPDHDGSDEDEEYDDPPMREGPGFIRGYRIRGVARVPTADRRRAVGQALVAANREGLGWALCFDPHYAVRASRGGQVAEFLICFWCGNVRVVGPGSHAQTYPIGQSAARLLRRELRRGGVGWLWFWRRWLG